MPAWAEPSPVLVVMPTNHLYRWGVPVALGILFGSILVGGVSNPRSAPNIPIMAAFLFAMWALAATITWQASGPGRTVIDRAAGTITFPAYHRGFTIKPIAIADVRKVKLVREGTFVPRWQVWLYIERPQSVFGTIGVGLTHRPYLRREEPERQFEALEAALRGLPIAFERPEG